MRHFKSSIFKKIAFPYSVFISLFYFSVLFYIVFGARRRYPVDRPLMRSRANLFPITREYEDLVNMERMTPHEVYEFFGNIIGNILLFIPLPFIIAYATRLKGRSVLFICVLASISIEITQYVLGIGIMDVDDVILNSLGASLGLWAYAWYKKRWDPILK